ncbi:hypothetical protein AXA44_29695 [Rhodococcus sp. SC4]|nr:hypothetical protein AXA44_29695 [Rhodococcus sp. SC4]
MLARIAAHDSWANTADRSARTAAGRKAHLDKFEKLVDPNGELSPTERAIRAAHARTAHFTRLALKAAQARRLAREARAAAPRLEREAAEAEAELAEDDQSGGAR